MPDSNAIEPIASWATLEAATARRYSPDDDRRRFFIMSAGRTGSTLLAAILADCGADFALPLLGEWDPGTGGAEHATLNAATLLMRRAYDIDRDKPPPGFRRYVWNRLRSRAKRRLRAVLKAAQYLKGENLDLVIQPAFKLGYLPSVILNYRRLEDLAVSSFIRKGASSFDSILAYYRRINRNGLLLMTVFGGCAIGYDQLADRGDRSWAPPLAALTGISAGSLIAARDRRLGVVSRSVEPACFDRGAQEIFRTIDALRGRLFLPSDQAMRSARRSGGGEGEPRPAANGRGRDDIETLVAGEGLEPPTLGL
jgi:hypothetical protein